MGKKSGDNLKNQVQRKDRDQSALSTFEGDCRILSTKEADQTPAKICVYSQEKAIMMQSQADAFVVDDKDSHQELFRPCSTIVTNTSTRRIIHFSVRFIPSTF